MRKNPKKKPHLGNLSWPGIKCGPAVWDAHATTCFTAVNIFPEILHFIHEHDESALFTAQEKLCLVHLKKFSFQKFYHELVLNPGWFSSYSTHSMRESLSLNYTSEFYFFINFFQCGLVCFRLRNVSNEVNQEFFNSINNEGNISLTKTETDENVINCKGDIKNWKLQIKHGQILYKLQKQIPYV